MRAEYVPPLGSLSWSLVFSFLFVRVLVSTPVINTDIYVSRLLTYLYNLTPLSIVVILGYMAFTPIFSRRCPLRPFRSQNRSQIWVHARVPEHLRMGSLGWWRDDKVRWGRCERNLSLEVCGLYRRMTKPYPWDCVGSSWRWTCGKYFSICGSYVSPENGLLLRCERLSMTGQKAVGIEWLQISMGWKW